MSRSYAAPSAAIRGDAVRTTLSMKAFGLEVGLTGNPAGGTGFSFGL